MAAISDNFFAALVGILGLVLGWCVVQIIIIRGDIIAIKILSKRVERFFDVIDSNTLPTILRIGNTPTSEEKDLFVKAQQLGNGAMTTEELETMIKCLDRERLVGNLTTSELQDVKIRLASLNGVLEGRLFTESLGSLIRKRLWF